MIQLCDEVIVPPFLFIFKTVLRSVIYLNQWNKKANIISIHKNADFVEKLGCLYMR